MGPSSSRTTPPTRRRLPITRHCPAALPTAASSLRIKGAFNFSAINNFGATFAEGASTCCRSTMIEVLSPTPFCGIASATASARLGAVGAKLYYPDDTIQHAGVLMRHQRQCGPQPQELPPHRCGDMYRGHDAGLHGRDRCLPDDKKCRSTARIWGLDEEKFASPTTMWTTA